MSDYKFRASWSVLSNWASGNWERAVKDYFKLDQFVTPAMVEGRDYHQKWSEYIKANNKMPLEFGGKELKNPVSEQKMVVQIAPWLELVYIIDCFDEPTLYEFKTGKTGSQSYASQMQMPLYAVGATYSGYLIQRAEIYHYDQYLKKMDMSVLWVTNKVLEDAHNWLVTLSGEMQNYLLTNKLYERFAKRIES